MHTRILPVKLVVAIISAGRTDHNSVTSARRIDTHSIISAPP